MVHSIKELTEDTSHHMKALHQLIPNTLKAFSGLRIAAEDDTVLSLKVNELIAMSIGIATKCEDCIGFHTEKLIKLGCTREEFGEALSVAIYMGGGPSLMYATKALKAYDEFTA